ncbi:ATP-dependent DNA ligase [Candidatus Woesearchaeota archaeon]|nr:ATP-dependent DNA ligase [Candidatus Woesearchaeota archaeon]
MMLQFSEVVKVFEELEKVSSGNKMRVILASFFKNCPLKSIDKVAYFSLGQIASKYEDINTGMADKMVVKAIASASKNSEEVITNYYKKSGDIGETAEHFIGNVKSKLSVDAVFDQFHKIAKLSGAGSQYKKIILLSDLLKNCSSKEAKYVTKIILGTLRLGVGDMTVLDSLAITFTGKKENKKILEHAYNICPDVGVIAKTIASKGIKGIKSIDVVLGRPIQMMLAQRISNIQIIKEKIPGKIAAEEKYDGERVQIHISGKKIVLFSRRLENTTHQFPDIVRELKKTIKTKNCIIEGEIVPIDPKGNLLPFQTLMQRKRKYEVEKYTKKVPICVYLFDILFLNNKSFLRRNYLERREALEKIVKESKIVQLAKQTICNDIECVEEFFNKSLERGCEGILAKSCATDSVYQAGTRGWNWIKWKREYSKELIDTFDLVVVGAFHGRGRRSGKYGALLCAVYNDEQDQFETLCKLGSGFTDVQLAELPKKMKQYVVSKKPARVIANKDMNPDVWFEPKVVVEVLGAEITRSPMHTCAEKEGRGFALRFPRLVRYRPDKKPEQATTAREIKNLSIA